MFDIACDALFLTLGIREKLFFLGLFEDEELLLIMCLVRGYAITELVVAFHFPEERLNIKIKITA